MEIKKGYQIGVSVSITMLLIVSAFATPAISQTPQDNQHSGSTDRIVNLLIEHNLLEEHSQNEQEPQLQTFTIECKSLSETHLDMKKIVLDGSEFKKDIEAVESAGGSDYFYMDFNPSSDPHTIDGGRFEGESWTCTDVVTQDDFDDTSNHPCGWTSSQGIYSAVRSDEDLNDGTSQDGAWCSCAMETGGPLWDEDSRGYATVSKSFNLNDYVDPSMPNFAFTDVKLYCDYKIYSNDFNHDNSYVYYEAYISDNGAHTWPISYEYFTGAGDAPSGTDGGYCIDVWDPSYTHPMHPMSNPNYLYDDYNNDMVTLSTNGQGGQTCAYLWDLFNNYGTSYTLTFKIFVRLYGSWGGGTERYQYWVDHARLKCYYEYFYPDLQVTDIWTVPGTFYHGDTVDIKGTVKNTGEGDINDPFWVDMKFDGSYIGSAYVSSQYLPLPPGGEITVVKENYQWPDDCNPHTVKIIADVDDDVEESNENNNWREESFTAGNHQPDQPSLTGTSSGHHGEQYTYQVSTTDPDGDDVKYYIDWGDGENTGWTGWYSSGQGTSKSHTWDEPGYYDVKAKAKDEFGAESSWKILQVYMDNRDPAPPTTPSGETSGYHGTEYTYCTSATDPDGDNVKYWFDWGDGENSGWTNYYNSGESGCASHSWDEPGDYQVKAKAKDEFGAESGWSTPVLYVHMANRAPDMPSNPNPENYDDWIDINADLSWECSDPDGDSLCYDIYLGTTNPPPLDKENHQGTSYDPGTLQEETTYYWQINAKDNWDETMGPVWRFTTREYNSPELSNYDGWPEGVDKDWGTCAELFTFKVHYYDPDGDEPDEKTVVVDGESYEMQGSGSDADYTLELPGSTFGGGYHQYHFWFTDGTHSPGVRLPADYEWGFTVNYPPDTPDVSGPSSVPKDEPINFSAVTIDQDGEDIQYYFDWDDGENSGWYPAQPVPSGTPVSLAHTWTQIGDYVIRVKARDIHGDESDWGTLEMTVPKNGNQYAAPPLIFTRLRQLFC